MRRAHAVHPVADLQIEYSLFSRGVERDILPTLRELGVGLTAYGVLSRGIISDGARTGESLGGGRGRFPRFQGENLQHNLRLVEALHEVAAERGLTVAQLAIAWVLSRGDDIVPLVGARRRDRLAEALPAADLVLSADDLARIEGAVPAGAAAGSRYDAHGMATLDSEREGRGSRV
jgi:aryl-alcohol dehydrogenase-like predicted oxidoreductase